MGDINYKQEKSQLRYLTGVCVLVWGGWLVENVSYSPYKFRPARLYGYALKNLDLICLANSTISISFKAPYIANTGSEAKLSCFVSSTHYVT